MIEQLVRAGIMDKFYQNCGYVTLITFSILTGHIFTTNNYAVAQILDNRSTDRLTNLLTTAKQQQWQRKPSPQLIQQVASSFLGARYQGGLLDRSPEERLVLSLMEFDCILFVEAVVGIVQIIRGQQFLRATLPTLNNPHLNNRSLNTSLANSVGNTLASTLENILRNAPNQFAQNIQNLRYRRGNISYCDRLHYFTDWVQENQRRGILRDITASLGGVSDPRPLNFMTQNRQSYPQLRTNDQNLECIAQRESFLATVPRFYVPTDRLPSILHQLRSGDIIGIATRVRGLDVTHTGFVHISGNQVGLIHASPSGQVEIAPDLAAYTRRVPESKGIIVVRMGS